MIKVRRAGFSDVETMVVMGKELLDDQTRLVSEHYPEHERDLVVSSDSDEIFKAFVKKLIRSKNGLILIAEVDGEPAGYMITIIKKFIPKFDLKLIGEITDAYVREDYRGTGVSTKLKDVSLEWLRSKGVDKVFLNAFPANERALDVYRSWGFSDFILHLRKNL